MGRFGEAGSGVLGTEARDIGDFFALSVSGSGQVEIAPGEPRVAITAEDNVIDSVLTAVDAAVLRIRRDVMGWVSSTKPIKVRVTGWGVKGLTISDSGDISVREGAVGGDLKAEITVETRAGGRVVPAND